MHAFANPDWGAIGSELGLPSAPVSSARVSGGSIHAAFRIDTQDGRTWFVKCNRADAFDNFLAEADGLRALAQCPSLTVPQVVGCSIVEPDAFLVLEWLTIRALGGGARSGAALAELHRLEGPHYGWNRDNYIGATVQTNPPMREWCSFWRQRLAYQLDLALHKKAPARLLLLGERLLDGLPVLLGGHHPPASLLHGDLWSGNAGTTPDGRPIIFDPACYYGDRETDLAMSELFGGFDQAFYDAYRDAWPVDPAYGVRRDIYNLYHVLNHFNLFGGRYAEQAQQMMERVLAEI